MADRSPPPTAPGGRPRARRRRRIFALAAVAVAAIAIVLLLGKEAGMAKHKGWTAIWGAFALSTAQQGQAAVPPTMVGVNLGKVVYYVKARAFTNLALGGIWQSRSEDFKRPDSAYVDKDGTVLRLPGDQPVFRIMTQPNAPATDVMIRCTYLGKGEVEPNLPPGQMVKREASGFSFRWMRDSRSKGVVMLKLNNVDTADPIRALDCREVGTPPTQRFDPAFVRSLQGFKVLRFMDWQNMNENAPVTWATRHTPASIDIAKQDGVPIEDMVDLANAVGADPWFSIPWNADDDYVRRFAQLVHDRLGTGRIVYVELANEVWNTRFPVSKQAMAEGQAANLSPNPYWAGLDRYAERTAHVMDIWAKVFADRPSRLVRVAACQNGAACLKEVLGFRDTPAHIDAVATAPYFGHEMTKTPPLDADDLFAKLDVDIDNSIEITKRAKVMAAQYGKRYIAYEGGQHVVLKDLDLEDKVQHDPRMYQAYGKYLGRWRAEIGDLVTLYSSAYPIGKYGAWGLSEYVGQPIEEAPKLRAVREFMGSEPAKRK